MLMKNSKTCFGWINTNCTISDTFGGRNENEMKGKTLVVPILYL